MCLAIFINLDYLKGLAYVQSRRFRSITIGAWHSKLSHLSAVPCCAQLQILNRVP